MAKLKRGKNFRDITAAVPEATSNDDLRNAANKLDDLQDLTVLAESAGGRVLIDRKIGDIGQKILELIRMSHKDPTLSSLIGQLARIEANIDLVSELNNAPKDSEMQQDFVDELVKSLL